MSASVGLLTFVAHGQRLVNTNRLFDLFFHTDEQSPVVYRSSATSSAANSQRRNKLEHRSVRFAVESKSSDSESDEEEEVSTSNHAAKISSVAGSTASEKGVKAGEASSYLPTEVTTSCLFEKFFVVDMSL